MPLVEKTLITKEASRQVHLVRVVLCDLVDRLCFPFQEQRSTKSHELNRKLLRLRAGTAGALACPSAT
jgi:hypothetical protein